MTSQAYTQTGGKKMCGTDKKRKGKEDREKRDRQGQLGKLGAAHVKGTLTLIFNVKLISFYIYYSTLEWVCQCNVYIQI